MSVANGLHTSGPGIDGKVGSRPLISEFAGFVTALTGNLVLTERHRPMLRLDAGGAARDVTLPAAAASNGLFYQIYNVGTRFPLTVLSVAVPVAVLAPGESAVFVCDESAWRVAGIGLEAPRVAQGVLSATNLASLFSTPVQLIAAPATGLYIQPVSMHWFLDHGDAGNAAFTGAAANEVLNAHYTNGSGAALFDGVAGDAFGAATADRHALVQPSVELIPVAAAAVVAATAVADWGGAGNAATVMRWRMTYHVRALAFGV